MALRKRRVDVSGIESITNQYQKNPLFKKYNFSFFFLDICPENNSPFELIQRQLGEIIKEQSVIRKIAQQKMARFRYFKKN